MPKSKLFPTTEKKYGDEYKDHQIKLYELYLNGIEKISDRRSTANTFFIGLDTTLATIFFATFQLKDLDADWLRISLATIGIVINIIYYLLIRSYRQLNSGKFKVLHEIETKLPLAMYTYEWEILGKGEDSSIYFPFSHIEMWIPRIIGIGYALYLFLELSGVCIKL